MRQLTKKSLDELAKVMPVVSEDYQRMYIGGSNDKDCWWRCIAYLKGCGTNYTEADAMAIAREYYGSNFSESDYTFSGSGLELQKMASEYFSSLDSYCAGQILVFDPNSIPDWEGDGSSRHAVIVKEYSVNYVIVYDPKSRRERRIDRSDLNSGAFVVNVR